MTRPTLLILIAATLSACGAPAATLVDGRPGSRTVVSVPNVDLGEYAQNQMGGTWTDEGRGADLLRRARVALDAARGFSGEVVTRSFGPFVDGVDTGVSREERVRYELAWARPNRFAASVLEATDADLTGGRFMTEDGASFRVRAPGVWGLLTRTVSGTDARFKNARGHAIGDLRPDAQFARMMGNGAIWTVLGEGQDPDGEPTLRIAVSNVPRLDAQIDREELELSSKDFGLRHLVSYVGMRRVLSFDFVRFQWGAPAQDAFKI